MPIEPPTTATEFPALLDLPFDPGWKFGLAAQHIVLTHFRNVLKWPAVVRANENIEGVHQIRVAARRTRTALQTFTVLWPLDEVRSYSKQLARFADAFGTARDLDVMLIYLNEQIRTATGERAAAFRWLFERNFKARQDEQPKLITALDEFESTGFAAKFVGYFAAQPFDLHTLGVNDG